MGVENPPKKRSLQSILLIVGSLIVGLGVVALIAGKGIEFVAPILMEPGPTNTMIATPTGISNSLKQPGILGELKSIVIEASNFKFTPNQIVVNQGDTVQISFTSMEGLHDLTIEGLNIKTKTVNTGGVEELTFVAEKKGTFRFYCSVGNHQVMGMEGILVVN